MINPAAANSFHELQIKEYRHTSFQHTESAIRSTLPSPPPPASQIQFPNLPILTASFKKITVPLPNAVSDKPTYTVYMNPDNGDHLEKLGKEFIRGGGMITIQYGQEYSSTIPKFSRRV
jgi:hypothetical protein